MVLYYSMDIVQCGHTESPPAQTDLYPAVARQELEPQFTLLKNHAILCPGSIFLYSYHTMDK